MPRVLKFVNVWKKLHLLFKEVISLQIIDDRIEPKFRRYGPPLREKRAASGHKTLAICIRTDQ